MNAKAQFQNADANGGSFSTSRGLSSPKKRYVLGSLLLLTVFLAGYRQVRSQSERPRGGFDLVDKAGNLQKPPDYRDRYQALGTFTVFDAKGGGEMHYSYASPGTAEY